MSEILAGDITRCVRGLFIKAAIYLPDDVLSALLQARDRELSPHGGDVLDDIIMNDRLASSEDLPICQDCGIAVLFVELGQDAHIAGGDFNIAVEEGIRQAYSDGYLRKSMLKDPLFDRKNTGDNTPGIVHVSIVPGDEIKMTAFPKGMGSENMSAIKMMQPADGAEGVEEFVVNTVKKAGPNPCPPIIVGVGIGGNFETCALMAKKALIREIGRRHPDPDYFAMEERILSRLNSLGIGPGGLGGMTTALAVHIEKGPCHLAGLPVAVNICCHASRHAEAVLRGGEAR